MWVLTPLEALAEQHVRQGHDCFNRWGSDTALWVCGEQAISSDQSGHVAARVQALVIRLPQSVVVVDPGATYLQGIALAKDLRRVFPAQQYLILNSRAQADHVMASEGLRTGLMAQGLLASRIQVRSGALTQGLMSQRCPDCLQRLRRELGPRNMRSTRILIPHADDFSAPLDETPSGELRVFVGHGLAFSEDLLLRHNGAQWHWLGVLAADRLPDLQQGSVVARLDFLKSVVADGQIRWFLGSFGEVSREQIVAQIRYFEVLFKAASVAVEDGADSIAAVAALRQLSVWSPILSDSEKRVHELNLQRLVRQAEEALFEGK